MNLRNAALALTCAMTVMCVTGAGAQEPADITLPAPRTEGGMPLMQALKARQTGREFSARKLPPQIMSDLLWAAAGINRADSGKRTAPSARNWQEIDVYAVTEDGAFLYDAKANVLRAVAKGDLRRATGSQPFVTSAPLNLVFVADTAKMRGATAEDRDLYAGADAAYMSQNVYLFCASEGLATVVRGMVDRRALPEVLKLTPTKRVIFAQTVGYPPEAAK